MIGIQGALERHVGGIPDRQRTRRSGERDHNRNRSCEFHRRPPCRRRSRRTGHSLKFDLGIVAGCRAAYPATTKPNVEREYWSMAPWSESAALRCIDRMWTLEQVRAETAILHCSKNTID
jgi:hypothetical protein